MIKRFYILLLAIVASVGMSYALTPRSGDSWDDNTKTLTVNSNPQDDHYHDQSEIKRLVISSSVTEIGEQAFSSSYNLESVIAYNGLQVIDQDAFFSCPKLESVILPSTLREVRYSAFAACDNLKYVTINAPSLQAYQEYAFDDAHENLKIYVPEASLATYKTNWSAYADKFQAIPSSLAVGDTLKVGDAMYSATDVYVDAGYLRFQIKASSLHTISSIAPNGNGKIKVEFTPYAEEFYPSGSYAALTNWIYCYSEYTSGDVTEITVVSGTGTLADPFVIDYVQPAAPAPANSCGDGLTWELNGGVLTISYDGVGTGEMYDFGYEYDANPVNVAPWKENKSEITTVVIGDGVKSIGNYAFNDLYENFTAVTIANSVERIGLNAFMNAKWITEITLPSSLKTIDKECFAANFGFTSITIPSGVTSIGNKAFSYCNGLTSLTCEATTPPTLASSVFYKVRSKTSDMSNIPLYVPSESVDAYTAAAQWNAFDVQAIPGGGSTPANSCGDGVIWELNDGALTISYTGTGTGVMDNYASASDAPWYSHKDDITSVTITDGVKSVGSYSFGYYGNLVTVTIGNDVETIGEYAFGDCYKFTTLNLGNSVKHIGNRAFMWAKVLTGFTLPSTLETIGERAFLQNKLITSLTIPSNVTSIGQSAFMYCAALTSVTVEATTPPTLGATVFDGVPTSSIPLHVPSGSVAAYTAADQWKDFDIQDPTPAYEKAMNLINAIGTVELTAECKAKIDAARAAYDALSDGDKAQVTNITTLTTAEAAFENVMNIWLSGDCDVILWKDTTLTVRKHAGEGNGAMADYNYASRAPWYSGHWYDPKPNDIVIKSVTVEEGVTHLGDYAFAWMSEMKTATIPSSVTTIPKDAFYWSKAVDDIYLTVADPSNLTWVLPNTADVQFKPNKGTNAHVPADLLTAYQETFGTLNMTFVGDLDPITPLTPEQQQALDAAKGLINAIPSPVVYTPACKDAIDAARAAYDALTPDMLKQLVSNYATLTAAEATYANLKDVSAVEAKINNIPQPVELKLATRDSIESARAAYEALTADQQALVSNYQTLLDAEAELATLNPGGGAPAGTLNGKFTINADGDQIAFSKGNLQATTTDLGANWTWGFAANQWNYLGIAVANSKINGNGTVSENGTVDLFGWSTAATYYGINNSYKAVDYIGDFVDWGPNMGAGWRTLTKDEWAYLLQHSSNGKATVNDKNGYIFLPDNWSGPAFTANPDNFTTNVYSGDDWTAMENAGAVFLPSGPARNGTYALIANDAKYCSSTSLNNDTSYVFTIYYNQSQSACTGTNRAYGCMVRLVTEGGGATPLDSAQVVKDLIEAIPAEITLDAACVNAVQAARDAYNALTEATKGALDPAIVNKLTDAEAALTALNQAVADEVIAKINNIPTPVELKLATRDSINNARAAYDALNAAQQALVSNYTKLTDAEAALAELNKGGSASVDIVWDINTGINEVAINTTSPAYDGITITTGNGNRFYQTTTDPVMLRFFFSGGKGSYAFAQEDGTHFTKVALISSVAMGEWLREPSRIGTDWVVSDDYKKATWTGDADTVKIWDGASATAWVDVDSIVFTVNASSTPLDSAQAVKGLIEAIRENLDPTEACGAEIAAALNAYDALSDAAKGALDAADVQKLNDAATQYPALDAIAAIDMIPAEITYDPMTKSYIEIAKTKYDELSDASKALVPEEKVNKLTNALEAWAILVAKIEHNVSYIGKDGELKNEKVALLHIPDPAPDFNGYEFVRWDVKGGDFLEEGLRIKAVYTPIITTNPAAYDTLVYNGTAQTLVTAGVAKEGHIEYRINDGEWSAELPKATFAAAYVVYYKLVREGHEDYLAGSIAATIAKAPVTYTAPTAVETLVYNASNQTLIAAGQTNDGTFEYTLAPNDEESWNTALPQAKDAGTYSVYYRVQGDLNHLDSTAVDPIVVTIAKAELTATADNKAIIFGELAPQFTVTYAGWQGEDKASVLTGAIAYATPYVRGNNVGEYTITPSGVDAANYTINFVDGTLTVNRKSAESSDIMAAQEDDEQLVYTNAVNKPTILVKDTTLTLTEEKDYTLTFVGRGETEYIESATAPTHVGEYTAKIEFIGNYKDMLTVDFTISKAELTITADDKENIFGEEAPEFTVSYEGFLGTDTKDVLTGSQAYACEYVRGDNVGDYRIIPSGVDAHDYVITFVNGTLTVNRKSAKDADIVAAQLAGEALVYDAEVNRPTIVVTDTTLTLTEEKDYVLTFIGTANDAAVYEESAVAPVKAGDYTAIVAFIGNYIDTLTVDFTVSKAPLTITADDKEMIYGDEHPEFTVSYDGFLGTDDNSVLLGTQGYSCSYAPGSYIGTYAITPKDVEAYDYAITFVDGTLTVNKAEVKVVGAEAQIAKIEDGNTDAVVLNAGQLEGIKLNDAVAHETTASFSDATVGENKTITLFYELTGDAALLANYDLIPTSNIFTGEGVIIEDFIPAEEGETEKEDEEAQIEEGIEVYAYGYCLDDHVYMRYHLNRGNPDQYKIEFADNRFTDVNYGDYTISGPDGTIEINIPVDMPTGDYQMTVTFRDSRFDWLESNPFTVTFHVNLPETYVKPLFENTIVLVDTCNCFTDIQWYHRADASEAWQPIAGATGHYYRPEGGAKLTGEFFVKASMNGEPTYTCGQTDMETLYGADKQQPKATVKAFPNPVVNSTTVTIENSENWNHSLRVVNTVGIEMFHTTFEGNETELRMDGFVQGNYMISVDGIVVKVMKK